MRVPPPIIISGVLVFVVGGALWFSFNQTATREPVSGSLFYGNNPSAGKSLKTSGLPALPPASEAFPLTQINELTTYRHPTGLFSVSVPSGWAINERLESGKLAVSWVDPNKNSVISVEIFATPASSKKADLILSDKQFIEREFEEFPDFYLEEVAKQPDGSSRIVWGYSFTSEEKVARAVINRFIQQNAKYTTIISVGFMEQHFAQIQPQLLGIANSFTLNSDVNLPKK